MSKAACSGDTHHVVSRQLGAESPSPTGRGPFNTTSHPGEPLWLALVPDPVVWCRYGIDAGGAPVVEGNTESTRAHASFQTPSYSYSFVGQRTRRTGAPSGRPHVHPTRRLSRRDHPACRQWSN